MKRPYISDLLMASSVTGKSVKEIQEQLKPPTPTIRGKRADMIIFDCACNCPHLLICQNGKECPYDKEVRQE